MLLGVFFLAVAMELALRWRHSGGTVDRWAVPDKRYGFLNRRNFSQDVRCGYTNVHWLVRINSLGFRGAEPASVTSTTLKILCLGDSFTFGYGVNEEDTFAMRLSQQLKRDGLDHVVYNAGVTGWGTLQELLYARDHLELLKPDVIILTYCENDPIEDEVFLRGGAAGLFPSFPGKRWVRDHSRLYGFLYELVYRRLYAQLFMRQDASAHGPTIHSATNDMKPLPTPDLEAWWKRTGSEIMDFYKEYRGFNSNGLLFIQATEFWKPDSRDNLMRLANTQGVVYVNLAEAAVQWTPEQVRLGFDPHWNPKMHALSAQMLYSNLIAHGCLEMEGK